MVQVGSGWFEITADSRGNRLADYRATRTKDGSRCFIEASCCSAVLNQIQMVLDGRSPRLLSTTDFSRWQYKIEYEPPYSSSIHNGLEMLKTVLTLGETDEMDGAIALDFYKIPEEGVPGDQWENTEVGQLIHRGKYYSSGPSGAELSKRIAETMSAHPYYAACETVIAIPGNKHDFGERLAKSVAVKLGLPGVLSRREFVPTQAAKTGHASTDLEKYSVPTDLSGERVVIVDDVYRSGISMRSVAAAARKSGATEVVGIVGARTMRK
jgi:hypothetical protein